MSDVPTLSQVLALLDNRADPRTAEGWDRVGLVTGDPQQRVRRVMFAVDATPEVVADATSGQVQLLVTHHPLLLRGVSSIAENTSRGRSLARLVRVDCGLFTMHTNADQAAGGVNDALADAVGMNVLGRTPLRPLAQQGLARVIVHVPEDSADALVTALAAAGAGRIGDYDSCAYWVDGTGQFRPLPGAQPYVGAIDRVTRLSERRVEMVCPRVAVPTVVAALRASHPYEEPAFSVVDSMDLPGATGTGRVGQVPPTNLADFAGVVAGALPPNVGGVRVAGDPDRAVSRVAVCGGAGDSLLADAAASGADVYVTSDLRHHPASDFVADHDVALIDIPHASGESLWLHTWARQLESDAGAAGLLLSAQVNSRNTDPWTFHVATRSEGAR